MRPADLKAFADAAPIFGWWNAHVGWGTVPAILIGTAAVVWGTSVAQRLSWRALTFTVWATSFAWAFALAMIDGWQRGFAGRLTSKHEYLRQVPTITDIPTGGPHLLQPNPRLPAELVDHPRLRSSARRAADLRLAGPHRAGRWCVGGAVVRADRVECGRGGDRRGPGAVRRGDGTTGRAVRRGGPDGDLDRGLSRRLLRRGGGLGYRPAGVGRSADGAMAVAGSDGCRAAARVGRVPQLRAGPDGPSRGGGAAVRG